MVYDFREEIHVERCKDQFGKVSFFPYYNWCHTKTDLADNTVQVIDFGEKDEIGKICQLISDFEPTEADIKLGIKTFLDKDRYQSSQSY